MLVIEYKGFRKRKKEYRELEHFAEFLSNLKDQFYLCKNVTESIFRAAERMPGSLRKGLEEICFLLEEDAAETVAPEESFPKYLKYVRLFWIQCASAVKYGSGKKGTESVFVKNMTELRRDVQNECYWRAQAMYLFAGLGVVSVLPVVFLPFIRWFGRVTMEELQIFYEGRTGKTVVAVFVILTFLCYMLLCMIRQTDKRIYQRPEWLRKIFNSIEVGRRPKYEEERGWKKGADYMEEAGLEGNNTQFLFLCGLCAGVLSGSLLFLFPTDSLAQRILVFVFGGVIGVGAVIGFYRYLAYLRRLGMRSEVQGLLAMVLLVIDVPNITIIELLDVLGACGELFRRKLLRCADAYAAEDVKALEKLFEEETHPTFRGLAGRLLASEHIGLEAAFAELAADRHFFREQLRLDVEQEQKKKATNAQIIAFLPMMFLLFAYLILPFLGVSLEQMKDIFREMEQVRFF